MVEVAYHPQTGRVFRVVDDDDYPLRGIAQTVQFHEVDNEHLVEALEARPDDFVYDGTDFVDKTDGSVWSVSTQYEDSRTEFDTQIPSLQALVDEVQNANGLRQIKPAVEKMARALYTLAQHVGVQ